MTRRYGWGTTSNLNCQRDTVETGANPRSLAGDRSAENDMTRTNSRTRKATTSTASMSSNPATSGGMGTPATMAFGPLPISPPPDVDSSGAGMARAAAGCTGGLHAIHELITQTLGSKPPMPPAANGRSASDLTQVQERRPERFFFRPGTDTSPFSPSNAEMAMSCKAFVALPDGVTAGWCPPPRAGGNSAPR